MTTWRPRTGQDTAPDGALHTLDCTTSTCVCRHASGEQHGREDACADGVRSWRGPASHRPARAALVPSVGDSADGGLGEGTGSLLPLRAERAGPSSSRLHHQPLSPGERAPPAHFLVVLDQLFQAWCKWVWGLCRELRGSHSA